MEGGMFCFILFACFTIYLFQKGSKTLSIFFNNEESLRANN